MKEQPRFYVWTGGTSNRYNINNEDGEVIGLFPTFAKAKRAGEKLPLGQPYAIQKNADMVYRGTGKRNS